jgi:PKD repeat protein
MQACKDDEFEIPLASTQANFEYDVTEIVVDENEEIIHYQVDLFNKSLLAQSYHWDFGNGETSTEENPL